MTGRRAKKKGRGTASLPRQESKESGSEIRVREEAGQTSIQAGSWSIGAKRTTRKATSKGKTSVAKSMGAKMQTVPKKK